MVAFENLSEDEQMALKTSGVKPADYGSKNPLDRDALGDYARLQIPLGMQHEAAIISELSGLISGIADLRRKFGLSTNDYVFELKVLIKTANDRLRQRARLGRLK